jgi:hypothetical protein
LVTTPSVILTVAPLSELVAVPENEPEKVFAIVSMDVTTKLPLVN